MSATSVDVYIDAAADARCSILIKPFQGLVLALALTLLLTSERIDPKTTLNDVANFLSFIDRQLLMEMINFGDLFVMAPNRASHEKMDILTRRAIL